MLFFLTLTSGQSSLAQSGNAAAGLIHLDVVVVDATGRPALGLQTQNFTLLDNGHPAKIVSFQAYDGVSDAEPPVAVILVIDRLELPENLVRDELNSVEAFLRRNGGHLAEPVSLYTMLETGLWQVGDTSRDGNALAGQVAHTTAFRLMRRFRGSQRGGVSTSSGLTDPPSLNALKSLGEIATAERRKPGRKLLLWVGPGSSVGSGLYNPGTGTKESIFNTICWFSTLLREARIALYSFSLGETDPSEQYQGYVPGVGSESKASFRNLDRKVLAVQSGGRVLNRSFDLVAEMESCVGEAKTSYAVTFDPSQAAHLDEYHTLELKVDKPGLTARSNTGYYDQPFYLDVPDPSIRKVTVAQLEQTLKTNQKAGDGAVAEQLSTVALTERLDGLPVAEATHGKKTEQAITMLDDASAFLPPPAATILADAPPDANAQQHMIALVANYLQQTIAKLPDFFAIRTTAHYQETSEFDAVHRRVDHQPLHLAERYKETVLYRDGKELTEAGTGKRNKRSAKDPYLVTYGTFGPVLGFVQDAISPFGFLTWSHWEQSPSGPRAVFRYHVSAAESRFLQGCCLPDGEGTTSFEHLVGYRGEITINPASGAVLRLQAEAEIQHFPPISRSEIVITYGPVEIGAKTFICPQRSVSLVRTRSLTMLGEWDEGFRTYGPWGTLINDVTYADYHMFRGESRVLPGFNPDVNRGLPDSTPLAPRFR